MRLFWGKGEIAARMEMVRESGGDAHTLDVIGRGLRGERNVLSGGEIGDVLQAAAMGDGDARTLAQVAQSLGLEWRAG